MVKLGITLPRGFLDEESRIIRVPALRKQLWAVELDLLAQLDRVCRKHGIRYFCDGGTSLGAARHQGFIPWDDDVDVIMTRAEYRRLCEVAASEFSLPYFFQTHQTDPEFLRGHAQLRNSDTTAILKCEMAEGYPLHSFNQGVFIDIFPFDRIPDDEQERNRFFDQLQALKGQIEKLDFARSVLIRHGRIRLSFIQWMSVGKALLRTWCSLRSPSARLDSLHRRYEELAQKYNGCETKELAPIALNPHHREKLPAEFFAECAYLPFEHLQVTVLKNYSEALTINYGNWHEHVVGGSAHGGMLVDVDRPYTHYLKKDH